MSENKGSAVEITKTLYLLCKSNEKCLHKTAERARNTVREKGTKNVPLEYTEEYIKEYKGKYYICWK